MSDPSGPTREADHGHMYEVKNTTDHVAQVGAKLRGYNVYSESGVRGWGW